MIRIYTKNSIYEIEETSIALFTITKTQSRNKYSTYFSEGEKFLVRHWEIHGSLYAKFVLLDGKEIFTSEVVKAEKFHQLDLQVSSGYGV